ncbi:stage II sporulation protein M [Halohasta litorea]|uniref:Stage II sporulation protein M n=1 Tax=Halohasta litorea TaxID=869891 RepID=A0ABD6D2X4_9EURY|nr:stage II sporulation protein M [Halohasta litorea]
MNIGTALRSGVRVLLDRPASVLPVYLLVAGITATTRVPVVLGLAAIVGILAADGRLDALVTELQRIDPEALDESSPETAADSIPPGLEEAVLDVFSPEILVLGLGAILASVVVSVVANGIGNAAAINGIYGCLYGGDGVEDAVVGVGRDWKAFVGITLVKIGVLFVGAVPIVLGASLFILSTAAGVAATLVGFLLSSGVVIVGLLLLAFAGQSIVVDGTSLGTAIRRSIGFPFGNPIAFLAYVVAALVVFGGLGVLFMIFNFLGVSRLSGIVGPLVAFPFLDAFKTALYADRPLSARLDDHASPSAGTPTTGSRTEMTDGGERPPSDEQPGDEPQPSADEQATVDAPQSADADEQSVDTDRTVDGEPPVDKADRPAEADREDDDQPAYRHRFIGAFREGLVALGGFTRHHPVPILGAAILFVAAAIGGWQLTAEYAVDLPAGSEPGEVFGTFPVAVFVTIAANNWLVSATAIFGGVALGVPTAVDMLLNGVLVGAISGIADPLVVLALVAPHGVIELPAIVIAGGFGFHLAGIVAGMFRGTRTSAELAEALRLAYRVLLGLAVVLVVASFIEAFVTPAIAEAVLA